MREEITRISKAIARVNLAVRIFEASTVVLAVSFIVYVLIR